MGDRGRTPAAELAIASVTEINRRPEPQGDLTPEQAAEWVAVVNRLPPDWFPRETHGLLAQYCRHVVCGREVASLLKEAMGNPDTKVNDLDRLLKMQEREGRAISSLATKMRISQQTTYDKSKKKGTGSGGRPCQM